MEIIINMSTWTLRYCDAVRVWYNISCTTSERPTTNSGLLLDMFSVLLSLMSKIHPKPSLDFLSNGASCQILWVTHINNESCTSQNTNTSYYVWKSICWKMLCLASSTINEIWCNPARLWQLLCSPTVITYELIHSSCHMDFPNTICSLNSHNAS